MSDYEEKRDLFAIDDFSKELPDLIDWAIKIKNSDDFVNEFKPLEGMSIGFYL